eukprot:gene1257-1586_t
MKDYSNSNNNFESINSNSIGSSSGGGVGTSHRRTSSNFNSITPTKDSIVSMIDSLELSTPVFGLDLKLKYLISICIFSSILFGSWGLLSSLLIIYLGTLYNKVEKQNQTPTSSPSLSSSSPSLPSASSPQLSSSTPTMENINLNSSGSSLSSSNNNNYNSPPLASSDYSNTNDDEYTPPAFHLYSSPTLRASNPNIVTFSPNTGRRLGSS